jgi:VWFA-related protein
MSLVVQVTRSFVAIAIVTTALPGGSFSAQDRQRQPVPVFRGRIALVPIDVRVVDRDGRPVTDLGKGDFEIAEDGVRQSISFCERQMLTAGDPVNAMPPAGAQGLPAAARLQNRRVFLVVFGRYWLPRAQFGMVGAVTRFLREQLLPQDYAAICAWDRATDLTTDHEGVARVIERLQAYQESVENSRERRETVLALYNAGGQPTPPTIRRELDAVFEWDSSPARSVPRVARSDIRPLLQQIERHAAAVAGAEHPPGFRSTGSAAATVDFDARNRAQTGTSTVLTLFSAIQYLRRIDGEKHVIYVPQGSLSLPALEDERGIARIASDARVAVHVIQANGLMPFDPRSVGASMAGGWARTESSMAAKHLAELTGGQAFIDQYPDRSLAQIDLTTRGGYLLAYYPSNPNPDGRHRKVTVTVARPKGATVLFRRSYLGSDAPASYDERQFIVQDRIMTAAEYDGEILDIGLKVRPSNRGKVVRVEVVIDVSRVALASANGRHEGSLEVALFCTDSRERTVGQAWRRLDLRLKEDTYRRVASEGLLFSAEVPVEDAARYLKVVVFDYAADRVGSAISRIY